MWLDSVGAKRSLKLHVDALVARIAPVADVCDGRLAGDKDQFVVGRSVACRRPGEWAILRRLKARVLYEEDDVGNGKAGINHEGLRLVEVWDVHPRWDGNLPEHECILPTSATVLTCPHRRGPLILMRKPNRRMANTKTLRIIASLRRERGRE